MARIVQNTRKAGGDSLNRLFLCGGTTIMTFGEMLIVALLLLQLIWREDKQNVR